MTYMPRYYGLLVWLASAFPLLFGPLWRRLMASRVESVYLSRQRPIEMNDHERQQRRRLRVACPVCLAGRTRRSYCRQEAHYFICGSCALIFQHPLPTGNSMVAWADEEYASGAYRDYVAARP